MADFHGGRFYLDWNVFSAFPSDRVGQPPRSLLASLLSGEPGERCRQDCYNLSGLYRRCQQGCLDRSSAEGRLGAESVASVVQTGAYFVVGNPVQPDRPCYIHRASEKALRQGIDDRQFCYVLSPKASGKTSLMARTIRSLREEGQLAAVVDLTQIAARGESAEAVRWYYSIAYRILRELRLKFDLQSWWQEKSVIMNEQRFGDFFWEIVLANTIAPITGLLEA